VGRSAAHEILPPRSVSGLDHRTRYAGGAVPWRLDDAAPRGARFLQKPMSTRRKERLTIL
jgi:hypothetical protein